MAALSDDAIRIRGIFCSAPTSWVTLGTLLTIRDFWRRTFLLPRIALATAGVAVLIDIGSYVGLAMRGALEPLVLGRV